MSEINFKAGSNVKYSSAIATAIRLQTSLGRTPTSSAAQPAKSVGEFILSPSLEDQAFNALVEAKVFTSKVATHLPDERRKKLFRVLDRLHDINMWEKGDKPLSLQSFTTFMRAMLALRPTKWPNLGLSFTGCIFGIWGKENDKLNMEFLGSDRIRWVLVYVNDDGLICRNAGEGPALEIRPQLAYYDPDHWFNEVKSG